MTKMATIDAYGKALVKLGQINDNVVVLDADLSKLYWCSLWICNSW